MIFSLIGRYLEFWARVRPGEASADRARVGAEFVRLGRPPAQTPATSR
jgi:hypothetical protein